MGKSSIHLQTAKAGTILHNSRENYSKSVVFLDEKNEIWNDSKTAFKLFREELEIRAKAYTNRTNQKLQKNTSTMISGVVNLEQHHTLKDMEKIKDELEKEFDTKVIQMSIHRDEGKLVNKKNEDLKLVSGKDFFLNTKDNELYFDSKFTKKINMEEWKIEKNYHGHFEMLGIDSNGNSLRKKMNIYKLSQLQDFTAENLKMERTPSNVIVNEKGEVKRKTTTNKKRLDTHEFKASKKRENEVTIIAKKEIVKEANQIIEEAKQKIEKKNETIRTQNETIKKQNEDKKKLKEELDFVKNEFKSIREMLKGTGATREDFKKIDELNKQLQNDLKNNDIDLAKATEEIKNLVIDLKLENKIKDEKLNDKIKGYDNQIAYIDNLQKQIDDLLFEMEEKISQIERLEKVNSILRENNEAIKKENEALKKENEYLKTENNRNTTNKEFEEKISSIIIDKNISHHFFGLKEFYGELQIKKALKQKEEEENKKQEKQSYEDKPVQWIDFSLHR